MPGQSRAKYREMGIELPCILAAISLSAVLILNKEDERARGAPNAHYRKRSREPFPWATEPARMRGFHGEVDEWFKSHAWKACLG